MERRSGGSEVVAGSFSITWLSSVRFICAAGSGNTLLIITRIGSTTPLRKTHPRCELFPLRRTSRHAWFHSHVWAACIIGTTGSKLPEKVCFLVRIILICHGRVSAAAGDSRGCILAEVCPGCYTDFRFPLTLRFQAQEQCGHGLLATDT